MNTRLEYYLNELDKAMNNRDFDYANELYNALTIAGYQHKANIVLDNYYLHYMNTIEFHNGEKQ